MRAVYTAPALARHALYTEEKIACGSGIGPRQCGCECWKLTNRCGDSCYQWLQDQPLFGGSENISKDCAEERLCAITGAYQRDAYSAQRCVPDYRGCWR